MNPHEALLQFAFSRMPGKPTDDEIVVWAEAFRTGYIALMTAVRDDKVRDRALAKSDDLTAECVRGMAKALDAVEHGELEVLKATPRDRGH